MSPGQLHIALARGIPWRKRLSVMHPDWQYRPITQIHASAPLQLTVPTHGLPSDSWPIWIEGTTASQLNADRHRQRFRMARVLDSDTLELNEINGAAIRATGGQLVYQLPVDFTDCAARMVFYSQAEQLLALTDGNGLSLTTGRIDIELTTAQVVELQPATRYELIITHADGTDIRWLCGEVSQHDCRKPC